MDKAVALKPRLSEKGYALSEERNTYIFVVPANINRQSVARAVESQYGVKVESVNIAYTPAKPKQIYRRGGRQVFKGKSSPLRKAYVRLKEGDKLPIFSAVEEDKKKAIKETK